MGRPCPSSPHPVQPSENRVPERVFVPTRITCSRLISLPLTWPEIDSSDRGQALCGMAGPDWPGVKWGPAQAYCPIFLASPHPLSASGLSGVHLSVSLSFFSSFCVWLSQLPPCHPFASFLLSALFPYLTFSVSLQPFLSLFLFLTFSFSATHPSLLSHNQTRQVYLNNKSQYLF